MIPTKTRTKTNTRSFARALTAAALVALATAALAPAARAEAPADTKAGKPTAPLSHPATPAEKVARGTYLVKAVGCADCHTPMKMGANGPEPDMARWLSGHPAGLVMPPAPKLPPGPWMGVIGATMTAWSGPWGVSFTANLTPDKETGLGGWTPRNFVDTIRNARHQGRGRPLLPPMPFPAFQNFTDDDLEAIFAYLQSLPPIKNRVPQPLPPPAAVTAAK